jgi:hypothetical protein
MKQATAIYEIKGIKHIQEINKAAKSERYRYLKEFRESYCDLFDMADFYYYAEMIGCKVGYLLNCARYTTDKTYRRLPRNIDFRYQFWKDNGHSITKPNPIFNS